MNKIIKQLGFIAIIMVIGFLIVTCDNGGGGLGDDGNSGITVTLNSVTADGSSSQKTTQLTLIFSEPITELTYSDITLSGVSGVSKGTLTGTNPYYLPVLNFTTTSILSVAVKKSGYNISGSSKQVIIFNGNGYGFIEMVQIPGGSFDMGDVKNEGYSDEKPVHTVMLSAFKIGKYEVTQEQYQAVMGSNPSIYSSSPASGEVQSKRPVEGVSWYDVIVFCNKLSIAEGLTPVYRINGSTDPSSWGSVPTSSNSTWNSVTIVSGSTGYRLPTEAQWEYAAKGGNGSPGNYTYSGSNTIGDVAWYGYNSGSITHEVGTKQANVLGLYDMSGNVSEWCWDWYDGSYYSNSPTNDPQGASSGSSRVVRSGVFYISDRVMRSASRGDGYPDFRYSDVGIRLARP